MALTSTLLSMAFLLMQFLSLTYINTLGELELFETSLIEVMVELVKTLHFNIEPDLDLTLGLNFTLSNVD